MQIRCGRGAQWAALFAALFCLTGGAARAQFQPERYTLTDAERQSLTDGCKHLRQGLDALRPELLLSNRFRFDPLPDVEIYRDAVERCLQQNLFFSKRNVAQAEDCLKEGESRLASLTEGKAPWREQTGVVVLGYRSDLDNLAQPYQAYIPPDHDFKVRHPSRLDVFLHGRNGDLNEIAFLSGKGWIRNEWGGHPPPNLALYPYGRGNNGWRFAGERDVYEAMYNLAGRYPVSLSQRTLRGFSMGGHGAWHIGLQDPGLWAAVSPGAGFVETRQYQKMTTPLPDWQQDLLHLYDPLDYADNARNLPLLAYVGEDDPARKQHDLIYAALKRDNVPFREFLGPHVGHRYEPKTLQDLLAAFVPPKPKGLRKTLHLPGPIDDALFEPVLAVTGTGTAWNQSAADFATKELQRFRDDWGMYFRATLPETTDAKLTADAIETHNLYLFGDPGSNAVLRRLLPKLPLKWTKDTITIAGKSFSAADHLPMLIFPNPEAPTHYVVIDTGFTFSNADMAGSNARQYPHLPDYAVISLGPTFTDDRTKDTVLAGFFDEQWRIPGGK